MELRCRFFIRLLNFHPDFDSTWLMQLYLLIRAKYLGNKHQWKIIICPLPEQNPSKHSPHPSSQNANLTLTEGGEGQEWGIGFAGNTPKTGPAAVLSCAYSSPPYSRSLALQVLEFIFPLEGRQNSSSKSITLEKHKNVGKQCLIWKRRSALEKQQRGGKGRWERCSYQLREQGGSIVPTFFKETQSLVYTFKSNTARVAMWV